MANSCVIVAIPKDDDDAWKVSSEKVPHITLLFLGDVDSIPDLAGITQFVEHAADTTLEPFDLSVSQRGKLGEDEADVVFFENWGMEPIKAFRSALLQNTAIKTAYDSAEQFPEWTPHLTIGYPESPARELEGNRRGLGLYWIYFDRIAIWMGDSEGPEFKLRSRPHEMEVAMSDSTITAKAGEAFLEHHGVKGMKWGKRKATSGGKVEVAATATSGKAKVKTKGGEGAAPHADAIAARVSQQRLNKSGFNALSNTELQALQTRLNLEKNVKNLSNEQKSIGKQWIAKKLKGLIGQTADKAFDSTVSGVTSGVSDSAKKK